MTSKKDKKDKKPKEETSSLNPFGIRKDQFSNDPEESKKKEKSNG